MLALTSSHSEYMMRVTGEEKDPDNLLRQWTFTPQCWLTRVATWKALPFLYPISPYNFWLYQGIHCVSFFDAITHSFLLHDSQLSVFLALSIVSCELFHEQGQFPLNHREGRERVPPSGTTSKTNTGISLASYLGNDCMLPCMSLCQEYSRKLQ